MKDRSASYIYKTASGIPVSNILEFLALGGGDEETLRTLAKVLLDYVNSRRDCADFRAAYMTRILYSYEEMLPPDVTQSYKAALLAFPYEDCGGHSMCTWTENHRLYAAGTEYLLAQKYPEETFGDGKDSTYHLKHAEEELKTGLGEMLKYGFAEWGSNNYYSETMAGLANLVQFLPAGGLRGVDPETPVNNELKKPGTKYDQRNLSVQQSAGSGCEGRDIIRQQAEKALLMMAYDILSQTFYNGGYVYNPACARAYADNKVSSAVGNYLEPQIRAMRGETVTRFKEKEGCMILLLASRDKDGKPLFTIPEEWLKLPDEDGRETALMQGVDIDEYANEGLDRYSPSNVRFAFKAGAISDHRVICRSARYLRESGLVDNGMLKSLKPFVKPILYRTGLLKVMKRFVPTGFDGAAMEKGRVYTFANRDYSVSAAFDYRVGQVLFQQNSLAVNLSHNISLFATNPYTGPGKKGSPGYWIGSGVAPRTAAYRNLAVCIFDLKRAKKDFRYTHLFLPVGLFDETDISRLNEGIVFVRTGNVNLCVRTNAGAAFRPAAESLKTDIAMYQDEKVPEGYFLSEYDLVNRARGKHFYVFEVDDTLGFEEFKTQAGQRELTFSEKDRLLRYSLYDCRLEYEGAFSIGGKEFVPGFKRPYR